MRERAKLHLIKNRGVRGTIQFTKVAEIIKNNKLFETIVPFLFHMNMYMSQFPKRTIKKCFSHFLCLCALQKGTQSTMKH